MLNASQSLPGARLILVSLVMRPAIRPFCTRHWGVCDGGLMFVRLHQCVFVSAYSRFVWFMCVCICVLADPPPHPTPLCKDVYCIWGRESSDMYSLSRYHVNALCFPSTCLCQTRGPLFSLPGLEWTHGPGPRAAPFFAGTIHQEFSSTDTAPGLISIQSICTGISAAGEESVCWNEVGRLHSERLNGWWRASYWLALDYSCMMRLYYDVQHSGFSFF